MENKERGTASGAERISGERLYALLFQLSERVRDVDLQVRALGRRLDAMKKEENGGRT